MIGGATSAGELFFTTSNYFTNIKSYKFVLFMFLINLLDWFYYVLNLNRVISGSDWLYCNSLSKMMFDNYLSCHIYNIYEVNFAQWRYTNQWSFREVVLLLVENWIPIPRLWDVKYRLICQFLKVFLQTKNNNRVQKKSNELVLYVL